MPRTRRTPAPPAGEPERGPEGQNAAGEDPAALVTPPTTPNPTSAETTLTSEAAEQTSAEAAKPARRRGTRSRKAGTAPVEAAAPPEAKDIGARDTPAEEPPKRRRGRRTATETPDEVVALPPIEAAVAPPPAETPAAETEAPKRRRGRRSAAETEALMVTQGAPPEAEAPPPARRRGRNRKALPDEAEAPVMAANAPEAPALPLPEQVTQFAEGTPTEEAAPARRRGRRRGAPTAAEAPPASETPTEPDLPDFEAPVVETESSEAGEEAAGDESDDKRGRRSRRGRRRRGGMDEPTTEMLEAAGATLLLEETPVVEIPDEDEDDALLTYPPPAAPVYAAPPIVPPVLPPADDSLAPRLAVAVQRRASGLARIRVGAQEHLPYFFFVNAETAQSGETVEAQIREAAANGIHLFSGVMSLPLRNAYGDRSFGAIDALIQQILTADPDGFVLPRLQFFPTNYWARTHPEQMARAADGGEGDVSLASTEFWADCVDALDALIAHFADPATPGGDRVLGFHLDRGEWFYDAATGYDQSAPNQTAFQNWLRARYQNLYALRAAWHDAAVTWEEASVPDWPGQTAVLKKTDTPLYSARREGRWPDYAQFSSELVADIIAGLAAAVKTLSLGRLLVAVSYGYTLEFAGRNDSGHLALGRLLRSPDIDIVAGPNAYGGRSAGSPGGWSAPIDSVGLHGKLWLVEDDTKTFLAEAETDDTYNPKIASGTDTQAIHQRHFGAALARGAGVTWMDLWGQGWLNSPDIWRELGGLITQAERWEQVAPRQTPPPDVAVLIDETSLTYLKNDLNGLGTHLVSRTRDLLLRAGGSVGFYLQSDVTRDDFPDSKLFLFTNALRLTTEERKAIREKLQKPGKTLAWLYAPGVFDENGPAEEEAGEVVGMSLRPQPWNSRGGSQAVESRHPITERIRGVKRLGQEEILNPLYAVSDPQAAIVAEYIATGATSLATREHKSGWKSVFFGDPYLTTELLRGLYAYAGIPVYDAQDDIVYAGGGVVTIHGSFTGQRTVTLPRRASVYDVLDHKIIATDALSFRAFVRARTTRLFLFGDGPALAAATGLELPAPSADQDPPRAAPPASTPRPDTPRPETQREMPRVIPGLESSPPDDPLVGTLDAAAEDEPASEGADEPADGDGTAAPARRSRWQRRRAAARARREAQSAEGAPEGNRAADPPPDIATLLPGLPPRRASPTDTPPPSIAAERVAGILASDTADDRREEDTD